MVRPAASAADAACAAPVELLEAAQEIGLPGLGVPESLGGIMEERSAMAGTLVAEALAHGDMGIAVAALAPGAVATAIGLWGTEAQQQTYLPAFTGTDVPAAALTLLAARTSAPAADVEDRAGAVAGLGRQQPVTTPQPLERLAALLGRRRGAASTGLGVE